MSLHDELRDESESLPETRSSSFAQRARQRSVAIRLVLQLNRLARQCALGNEILAAAPRPLDVLTSPLEAVAGKAERFAAAVSAEQTEFESHYRDNRKLVVAIAWETAYRIKDGDDRVAYEFACASLKAHRAANGTAILESLAAKGGEPNKYVSSARRRIARQAWKSGDLEQALLAMRSQHGRAARTQYRTWLGISTVRNGLLIAEHGDAENAAAVLTGGLAVDIVGCPGLRSPGFALGLRGGQECPRSLGVSSAWLGG